MRSFIQFLKETFNRKETVERLKKRLPAEVEDKIKKQKDLGVDDELIQNYISGKLKEREKYLKDKYFRTSIKSNEYIKVEEINGIQFFMKKDDKVLKTPTMFVIKREIHNMVRDLMRMRDILPIRKPRVVIKDLDEKVGYNKEVPPAYYSDRVIYLDTDSLDNSYYFIHEYAHYIVDLIPKQTEELLLKEYQRFLDYYFKLMKRKKEYDLSEGKKEKLRISIAKKLGLPSEYAFVNSDELFAEIIAHWKDIPNNKGSYRFKQSMKRVLTRL